jgi:hypothetical protein
MVAKREYTHVGRVNKKEKEKLLIEYNALVDEQGSLDICDQFDEESA